MPTLTIEYATDAERLMLEQAVAFFAELRTVAHTAPTAPSSTPARPSP